MKQGDIKLCKVVESDKKTKKYDAVFRDKDCPCSLNKPPTCGGSEKIVSFGQAGASDFTKTKDEDKKENYLKRHKENEDWNNPLTPGALSRWILWNKPTLKESILDFKKRFKL